MRQFTPIALALSLAALAGCSSKEPEQAAKQHTGIDFEYTEYTPDMREYHTSWGHVGRGGAAMRKPSYQPVLSSDDEINTRYGKLHPELLKRPSTPVNASVAVPPGLLTSNCNQDSTVQSFPVPAAPYQQQANSGGIALARAERHAPVNEYLQVRKKLCAGTDRLTYEEWLILVNGTPKDIPLHLQHKSSSNR